jgi:hypothetical protein
MLRDYPLVITASCRRSRAPFDGIGNTLPGVLR